jgi:hypothetical protein
VSKSKYNPSHELAASKKLSRLIVLLDLSYSLPARLR